MIGKKPSGFSLLATAIIEALLLVQLLISIWLVISGARAETDTLEFFGYLIVSLLVPVAAGFWSLLERTRWSTVILGIGSLTVAVMLVRMNQIWTGTYWLG